MMQAFRTENNYRNASRLSAAELRAAMASREILQSTALAFDTQRQRFTHGEVDAGDDPADRGIIVTAGGQIMVAGGKADIGLGRHVLRLGASGEGEHGCTKEGESQIFHLLVLPKNHHY